MRKIYTCWNLSLRSSLRFCYVLGAFQNAATLWNFSLWGLSVLGTEGLILVGVFTFLFANRSLLCSLAMDACVFLNKDGEGLLYLTVWCGIVIDWVFPHSEGSSLLVMVSLTLPLSLVGSLITLLLATDIFGTISPPFLVWGCGEIVLSLDLSYGDLVEIVFTLFGQGDFDLLLRLGCSSLLVFSIVKGGFMFQTKLWRWYFV